MSATAAAPPPSRPTSDPALADRRRRPAAPRRRLGPGPPTPVRLAALRAARPAAAGLDVGSATGLLDPRMLSAPWTVVDHRRRADRRRPAAGEPRGSPPSGPLLGLLFGIVLGVVLALVVRAQPARRGAHRRADPDQAGHPGAGAAAAADPVARHRRDDEGHHHHPRRLRPDLPPHPQRPARHRHAGTSSWPRPCGLSRAGVHPPGRAAGRAAGVPARAALRRHRRLAVPGRRRADQLHQRHRLHDGARPHLRPDRHHRRRPGPSTASSACSPTAPSASSQRKGAVMATHAGGLTARLRAPSRRPSRPSRVGATSSAATGRRAS